MKVIFIVLCLLSSNAYSKYPNESFQHLVNRIITQTDTIFVGKILKKREIERGLIVDSWAKYIGILEVEIKKVYRGHVSKNEKLVVCTWFDKTEHEFDFKIGQELTFSGINTGLNIQLPSTYGYILSSIGIEKEISKALMLKKKIIRNHNLIFEIVDSGDNVIRNVCNESSESWWGD